MTKETMVNNPSIADEYNNLNHGMREALRLRAARRVVKLIAVLVPDEMVQKEYELWRRTVDLQRDCRDHQNNVLNHISNRI